MAIETLHFSADLLDNFANDHDMREVVESYWSTLRGIPDADDAVISYRRVRDQVEVELAPGTSDAWVETTEAAVFAAGY